MHKQHGKFTVGALISCIIAILVVGGVFNFWLFSNAGLGLMGAMKETLPSAGYAVEASGNNLRAYEWTAKNGMKCIGVYSEAGGSWGNCEFPPVK